MLLQRKIIYKNINIQLLDRSLDLKKRDSVIGLLCFGTENSKNLKIFFYGLCNKLIALFLMFFFANHIFSPHSQTALIDVLMLESQKITHVLNYLKALNSKCEDLELFDSYGENRVCYFNYEKGVLLFFDSVEFNKINNELYSEKVIDSVIRNNELYFKLDICLGFVFSDTKYVFYKNIFQNYHFISWFFKSLRYSYLGNNLFDFQKIKSSFPKFFLSYSHDFELQVNQLDHNNFFLNFIKTLVDFFLIEFKTENIVEFKFDSDILNRLVFFSFESLVFGSDLKENNKKSNFDSRIKNFFDLSDNFYNDFTFNYILASTTDCVTYNSYSNNLYCENSLTNLISNGRQNK